MYGRFGHAVPQRCVSRVLLLPYSTLELLCENQVHTRQTHFQTQLRPLTGASIEATMGSSYSGQNTAGTMDSQLLVVLMASMLLKRASGRVRKRKS
jgi:hypothetical protein